MENKEVRFRILNKTNKTVTLKLQGKPMTFSWEEFNKKLIVVDKAWAVLNEEEKKKQEKAEDLINDVVVAIMIQRGNADAHEKLIHMGIIGHNVTEAAKILECSPVEVMGLVRQRLMIMNPFMVNPIFPVDEKQRRHRRKIEREAEEEMKPVTVAEENKPTIGDAFPGLADLRDKMEKEGKVMDEDM